MDGLRAATEAWLECLALSDANPLFNDPYWAQEYAAARLSSEEVFGWTLRNGDGEAIAVLPFQHELARSRFSLSRALLLADGSFDSDYLDFPIRRGYEDQVLATCLDLLAGERRLDAIVLSPIPAASETLKRLRPELERRGLPSRERTVECCVAKLPDHPGIHQVEDILGDHPADDRESEGKDGLESGSGHYQGGPV